MTQNQRLTQVFNSGRAISERYASAQYGIQNLRARVTELRKTGMNIVRVSSKTGVTQYKLDN